MVQVEQATSTSIPIGRDGKQIQLYLVNIDNYETQFSDLKELMDYFKYKTINFAIVDIEEEIFKKFKETPLAKLLNDANIPYHPTYMAQHTKKYFSKVILKKQKQIKNFRDEYNALEDNSCPRGRSLQFWIDLYSKEIEENRDFLNLKIKPQYLAKTILRLIDDCDEENVTFLHLGMEKTFPEIRKILKDVNPNMDISHLHYLC